METVRFKPWEGNEFKSSKVLILSESAYSWKEGNKIVHPSGDHPTCQIRHWGIEHFEENKSFYKKMGKALTEKERPTQSELERAWDEFAYTIYVQGTVGFGASKRPTAKMWKDAAPYFKSTLETLRPTKVIVIGKTMWNHHMPGCDGPHLCDEIQAYKLLDGSLVWCLAVPHPSNRKSGEGFGWQSVGERIRVFRQTTFPSH